MAQMINSNPKPYTLKGNGAPFDSLELLLRGGAAGGLRS